MAKKGAGRKRIPMEKIEDSSKVGVTFSKRRSGLFKKACAVRSLCDCHTAIVIFSGDNTVYSFGDPSSDRIFNSFIGATPAEESEGATRAEESEGATPAEESEGATPAEESDVPQLTEGYDFCQLMEEMTEYEGIVDAEKTRENGFTEVENDPQDENCLGKLWSAPVEELTLAEAEEMLAKLEDFKPFEDTSSSQAQT
ncbi:agamous-like MADS-box protein AGL62 [Daucus carota subsp. sativus]|uniref:agamous-like MADS-box protein AGL62 n=1 Tax=Daucus carota subsp. sativus TaxID=79200 RepID=UPI0007F01B80|nr:PREDICTED: agamous-like MADS-box protein AGL62 [Daucus carota subsp. sativus]